MAIRTEIDKQNEADKRFNLRKSGVWIDQTSEAGAKAKLLGNDELLEAVYKGLAADPGQFAVDFAADYLCHHKGRLSGQPLIFEPWQADGFIRPMFGTLNEDGLRRYSTASQFIPRKNGKSTEAAALGILGMFLEPGAEVYACALDRGQAGIVFDIAKRMVQLSPLRDLISVYQHHLFFKPTNSIFQALSADSASHLGKNPSMVIFDEVLFLSKRGADFYRTMSSAQGARDEPIFIEISTANEYDVESFGWNRYQHCKQVLAGEINDPTHLVQIFEADKDDEWDDEEVWAKANPNLGISVKIDFLRKEAVKARVSAVERNAFERYYLNRFPFAANSWINPEAWDDCAEVPAIAAGSICYAGADLATANGLTALVLVFPRPDGTRDVLAHFYIPESKLRGDDIDGVDYQAWVQEEWVEVTPGNVTDYGFIRRDINEMAEVYNLKELAMDKWNSTQIAVQLTEEDGINVVQMGQGYSQMSAPVKSTERFILDGKLRHGGHPVLRWNVLCAVPDSDASENIRISKKKSTGRVNGLIALVMAMGRCDANGYNQESVYAQRGLRSL